MRKKYIFAFSSLAILLLLVLFFLSKLTEPKYVNHSREGNLISEYYREADRGNSHEVIFFGDCEAYSVFVPPILYEEHGITSYVRGSPSQSIEQSYYLLLDTLKYETPRVVVLSVYSLTKFDAPKEAYNRMTLDGMRLSLEKISAVTISVGEDESAASYLLPLLRFHSRIYELEAEDMEYIFDRPRVSHNGYFMQKRIAPAEVGDSEIVGAAESIPKRNFAYLEKIAEACRTRGTELILIKSPISSWRYPWYDEWDEEIESFAKDNGLEYYNLIKYADEIGIDMSCDTYDGGFHLNLYGAEKTSRYFGKILAERHGIGGGKNEIWDEKIEEYYKERNDEEN